MSSVYEYCTLNDLRVTGPGAQLDISGNAADPYLLTLIREVSSDINSICNRKFAPYVATQRYDSPGRSAWAMSDHYYSGGRAGDVFQSRTGGYAHGRILRVDTDDLLEVLTLTNGDGTVIASGNLLLYPSNTYPKEELRLVQSSGLAFLPDASGNYEQVLQLNGVYGYHDDYTGSAWGGGGTLAAALTTAATAYTMSAAGVIEGGNLLKIESEYLYASSVAGVTATVERGVNGTTAAAHTTGTAVSFWRPIFTVSRVARMAAAAHWNLRANPEGKQVSINGVTFTTPNSVSDWMDLELEESGLQRTGLG